MTYYIVTKKKDNIADNGIIRCGISDYDFVYIIRHARLPKFKKDPKVVTIRCTKNLNNNTLIKDLNELPFELIRASAVNPLVKLEIFLDILNKHAPVKTIRVRGNNLPCVTAEVKLVMRQRDYLRGNASKTGSKDLRQAFQNLCNKVDYTLRKLKSDYCTKRLRTIKIILEICGKS